jgi:hypothetical protein
MRAVEAAELAGGESGAGIHLREIVMQFGLDSGYVRCGELVKAVVESQLEIASSLWSDTKGIACEQHVHMRACFTTSSYIYMALCPMNH